MAKSTKKKILSFLNLLILFVLFCCISGCGNSESTADDTTTGSGQKIALTGSPTSLAAGQTSILTATVTDSKGIPVSGATVAFDFVTNNSTGTVAALNGGKTDAGGQAEALYTAGVTNPTTDAQDTVQASVAGATKVVLITRTASGGTQQGDYISSLNASPSTLKGGDMSIISATVRHEGVYDETSNQTITFKIPSNNSGASFIDTNGTSVSSITIPMQLHWNTFTDISVTYKAGKNVSDTEVQDIVRVVLGNESTSSILVTRTASGVSNRADYISSINAAPSMVSGGNMSTIAATVRHVGVYGETSNQTITFKIPSNNSGASFIDSNGTSVSSITIPIQMDWNTFTDISVTYKAGTNLSGTEVQDIVQGALGNGSTSSTLVTRTASGGSGTVPVGYQMTVTTTPTSMVAGAISVIIAKVTNADGTNASGKTVTFGFVKNNSGAILSNTSGITTPPVTGITDASGTAIATYTAGNNTPSLSIQDAVSAIVTDSVGSSTGATIITRQPSVGTGNRIVSFTEDPPTTWDRPIGPPYDEVVMKVKVTTDDNTTPVVGKEVTFSIIVGIGALTNPDLGTSGSPITAITDNNGEAWILFTRPEVGYGDTVIRAQIEGTTYGGDAARIVYWKGIIPTLTLAAKPSSVVADGASTITATVTDGFGNAIINLPLTFTLATGGSGGSLSTYSGITDASGKAVTVLRAGETAPAVDSVSASASYLGFGTSDAVSISVTVPTP